MPSQIKAASCQNCVVNFIAGRTSKGMYCSNFCQQAFQSKILVERWLKKEVTGNTLHGVADYVRAYIFSVQGGCCLVCGLEEWRGHPIPLELEHKDGNSFNSSHENVCLLCANCHAMTPTYKGRNRGKGRLARGLKILNDAGK